MKSLGETPQQVAQRMRSLAEGVIDQTDANEIRRYADWLESTPGAQQILDESCKLTPTDYSRTGPSGLQLTP